MYGKLMKTFFKIEFVKMMPPYNVNLMYIINIKLGEIF